MEVYLACSYAGYDGANINHVFLYHKDAQKWLNDKLLNLGKGENEDSYWIEPWKVIE